MINILYLFLYFPEDKSEYIPAIFTSVIFLIAALWTMRLIVKHSKKELEKTRELEEALDKEK